MAGPNLEIKAVSNIGQKGWLFWKKKKKKKHQKFQLRLSVLQRPIIGRIKSLD